MSKRSLEANAKMWAMLHDVAEQVIWYGERYSAEDWKDILSAGLTREQRIVPGVNGGVVMLGQRTSKMSVQEMNALIEFIEYFGAEKGVRFAAPASLS